MWPRSAPRVRGRVRAFPGGHWEARERDPAARAALIAHVAAQFARQGCRVRVEGERIVLDTGAPGRMSPLAFVDGGTILLDVEDGEAVLRYDLSTARSLGLCAALAPVLALVAWFALRDPALAAFAFLAPVVWLYGANYVAASVRVPGFLGRSCDTARAGTR